MPGNDSGDRLHNFFLQDNSAPVQHHQQIADGAWSVVNNNLWVGSSPQQFGLPSANTNIYNLQHSDSDRGQRSHASHDSHGLNFTQTMSDFARHPSQNQQLNLNGCSFGSRVNQSRQDEANISAVDTIQDQYNFVSRGLSMYESHQGIVPQHQTKSPVRSGTSESPVSFDLFGNQRQMHHPQSSMLHLQQQQPGINDMHPVQQQIELRKMPELQRQHLVRQLDNRLQKAVNPVSSLANSGSGNNLRGAGAGNMNWQQNASSVMQGSSNGLVFSSNDGQTHHLMDLVPQQGDQSLYGVPVSSSRGNVTQFPQMANGKPLVQQMATFSNSRPGNQYTTFSEQAGMQEDSLVSRQIFPGENSYERRGLTIQQENSVQRIASPREVRQGVSNSQLKVATSQNEVSLDPTEERILFGSDDNIFAAFGKNPDLSEDGDGPFDSLQSGTWSALMQSAVAETSISDIGQQDELCVMSSQHTSVDPTNQHPAFSGRQEMSFDSDMRYSLNTSAQSPDNNGKNTDYQNVSGVQQLGNKLGPEHGQRLYNSTFQREPSNLSNPGLQNAVTEVRTMHGNARSLDTESNMKHNSGPWTSSQSVLRREYTMSNGWNTLGSVAPADYELNRQPEKLSQLSQGYEQKRVMEGEVHGGFFWNSSSMPQSSVEAQHAKSIAGNLPTTRDGYSLSNSVGSPNLSNTRLNEETSQHLSNQGNYWKIVNPMVKSYGGESMAGSHHHINKENETVDSALNTWNKAELISSQRETYKQRGNSQDSFTSNLSGNNSAGGMNETGLSDVSDSRSLPSRNQNLVNQIGGWKTSGPPKFQFHPMGNLEKEVEPQYALNQSSISLGLSQKSINHGHGNTSRIPGSSVEMETGHLTDPNDVKDTYSSQNMLELLDKVDQSRDHAPMMHSAPSGHNVSSEKHETDNSGISGNRPQRSQSSSSQGFGLQLGPPSHRTAVSNQQFLPQSNLQAVANSHQIQIAPEFMEKGQLQLPTIPSGQSLTSVHGRIPGEFKRNRSGLAEQAMNNAFMHKLQENLSSAPNSGITYSSQSQYLHHMARTSGQVSADQCDAYSLQKDDLGGRSSIGQSAQTMFLNARSAHYDNSGVSADGSQQIGAANQHSLGWVPPSVAKEPVSVSLPVSLSGSKQQGTSLSTPPNTWSNVPGQPHLFSTQIHNAASNVPQLYQASVLESSSSAPHREAEQAAVVSGFNSPAVSGSSSMNRDSPKKDSTENLNSEKDRLQGMEHVSYNLTDGSPARTAVKQNDIAAFGRSLVSNNNLAHQHYSLRNQMQTMKSAEPDTNDGALERVKGLSSVEGQKQTPNAASRNADLWPFASGDSGAPSISGLADNAEGKTSTQFGNVPSQNSVALPRVDHPHVSPQMAPSWFNHYGTFRNGQMLAINDTCRGTIPETVEQPFTLCTSGLHTSSSTEQVAAAAVDPGQHLNIPLSSTILTVAIEPQSLQLTIPRPRKRKRQTFCHVSWHNEVSQKSQTPKTMRMAEDVWAKAVNRIPEKIEDEVDLSENGPTTLKAKRRLSLTTHLMQQLICPPIPYILSSDAESAYESGVYSISRLALGEACGLVSHSSSDFNTCHDGVRLSSDKRSEKVNDRHLSKVMTDFRARARNLETDFFRLDKRVSLADLRVECQELEKFSVINRFAKFHGRGQSETSNPSSLSDVASKAPRPYLQRYVTALPAPRSLPDRVHCLPL